MVINKYQDDSEYHPCLLSSNLWFLKLFTRVYVLLCVRSCVWRWWIHICLFACLCGCAHVCTWGKPEKDFECLPRRPLLWDRVISLNPRLDSELGKSPCFYPQCWGFRHTQLCLVICMGTGDLNSGPHAYRAGVLNPLSHVPSPLFWTYLLLFRLNI